MSTSTIDLEKYAQRLFIQNEFLGVYSIDTLPKTSGPFKDTSLIINTDTSNLPGTHWVAILTRDNEAYYFDPFGYPPPLKIASWLNKYFSNWSHNQRQIQSITSNYCGYFCLYFLYAAQRHYFRNIDMFKIIDHLFPKTLHYVHYQSYVTNFINDQFLNE